MVTKFEYDYNGRSNKIIPTLSPFSGIVQCFDKLDEFISKKPRGFKDDVASGFIDIIMDQFGVQIKFLEYLNIYELKRSEIPAVLIILLKLKYYTTHLKGADEVIQ